MKKSAITNQVFTIKKHKSAVKHQLTWLALPQFNKLAEVWNNTHVKKSKQKMK